VDDQFSRAEGASGRRIERSLCEDHYDPPLCPLRRLMRLAASFWDG